MSVQRLLAGAALVAALAALGLLALRGGESRSYDVHFTNAGLLVKGANVLIGGKRVGSVSRVSLTGMGEADATVELAPGVPALHAGTTASLEEPSLSGAANRYVALNPGPNDRPVLADGATIGSADTTSVVELDELYDVLDPKTRDGLRDLIRGQADTYRGRARDAARFYEALAPSLQASDHLFRELGDDKASLRRFLSASGRLASTLRASSADLYGAVEETARGTTPFAVHAASLERALRALPGTLREGRSTFARLRSSVDVIQPFLGRAAVAGRELPAFSSALRSTLTVGGPALGDLAAVLDDPGGQDLVALLQGLPRLARAAAPAFRDGARSSREGRPLIDQLRAYVPDLVASWSTTGRAMANYDANGHYARVAPQFGAFRETTDSSGKTVLEPISPSERILAPQTNLLRRCPGSASQPPADGSAPLHAGLECDPSEVPGG